MDYTSSTNVLLTLKCNNETDVPLNTKCSVVNINKAHTVKMSAALLLLMNSLWQMLDTAYVNRLLLKNGSICMTKPDGFRVEGRKEREEFESVAKRRQDRLGLLDRCTGIASSLPVRRSDCTAGCIERCC